MIDKDLYLKLLLKENLMVKDFLLQQEEDYDNFEIKAYDNFCDESKLDMYVAGMDDELIDYYIQYILRLMD